MAVHPIVVETLHSEPQTSSLWWRKFSNKLCNFTAALRLWFQRGTNEVKQAEMSQVSLAGQQLYLARWIAHLTLGISASSEDSRKVTHVVNNPKLNHSAVFQSRHDMRHKDKKIVLALCGGGVVLFGDYSDPFSKAGGVVSALCEGFLFGL